jgi:hypothetical protein
MFFKKEVPLSDRLIEEATVDTLRGLKTHPVTSEEYARTLDAVIKLRAMRSEKPSSMDKNTRAVIGANLLGILMIIKHERVDIITSKALNLVLKPRM